MTQEAARILLADDHASFLQTTTAILLQAGYQCDSVSDAMAAVARLEQQDYDLFIADIKMPGNDHLELLHTCTSEKYAVPLMLVTGSPSIDTAVESLRARVVDYILKPLDVPEFLRSVARAIAKGRLWKSMRQTSQDMQSWAQHLEQMAQAMALPEAHEPAGAVIWSLERYLEQTTNALVKTALNLHQTLAALRQGQSQQPVDVCSTLQCPRRTRYEAGIDDAIAVIKHSREAFKSRALGDLRRRLEELRHPPTSEAV